MNFKAKPLQFHIVRHFTPYIAKFVVYFMRIAKISLSFDDFLKNLTYSYVYGLIPSPIIRNR